MAFSYNTSDFVSKYASGLASKGVEGKILVASPSMDDPNFSKALVYICAHDEGGAVGVMINQPIGILSAEEVFQGHMTGDAKIPYALRKKSYPILFGGGVNSDMIVALSITKQQEVAYTKEDGYFKANLHIDASHFIKDMVNGKAKASKCIFARGICAWDGDGLEQELENNYWLVANPDIHTIFSQKRKDKWSDIMLTQFGIKDVNNVVSYSASA